MPQPSGLLSAGRITLAAGAWLTATYTVAILLPVLVLVGYDLARGGSAGDVSDHVPHALQVGLLAASITLGLLAFARARAGDARGASARGLVAGLLPVAYPLLASLPGRVGLPPPSALVVVMSVQYVLLAGAVLCRMSPEARHPEPAAAPSG